MENDLRSFNQISECNILMTETGGMVLFVFFQAEDGIRDRSPSRGLGDVYKRQFDYWGIAGDGQIHRNAVVRVNAVGGGAGHP